MPIDTLQQAIADTLVAQKEASTKSPADRVDENTKTTIGVSAGVRRDENTYVEKGGSVWVRQENFKKLEKGNSDRSDCHEKKKKSERDGRPIDNSSSNRGEEWKESR